ncbi:MAG: hypothetical protein KKH98_07955 [Spirochaetes bacterium]|nr:hypothetical protein [Spirochaetota bacterium]
MADLESIIKGIETLYKNADGKNQCLAEKCITLYDLSIKIIEAKVEDPKKKGELLYKCWWLKHECLLHNHGNSDQITECNFKMREHIKYKPS